VVVVVGAGKQESKAIRGAKLLSPRVIFLLLCDKNIIVGCLFVDGDDKKI